jgi:hypothetical protein
LTWLHYLCIAGVFWSVLCRAARMDPATDPLIKLQHAALLLLTLSSAPTLVQQLGLPPGWPPVALGLAVCIYLAIDARRWASPARTWQ